MAARDSPTVKAVAVTSSFGAVLDFRKPALEQSGKTYTEDDWFTSTYEEAAAQTRAGFWYSTSKTLAEKEGRFQSCRRLQIAEIDRMKKLMN